MGKGGGGMDHKKGIKLERIFPKRGKRLNTRIVRKVTQLGMGDES